MGGERTWAWARHLHRFGYYPVVLTRNWNPGQADLIDAVEHNTYTHEKYDTYEVHRLPYRAPLRDKISRYPALRLLQKALTFIGLVLNNFWVNSIAYANLYTFARNYLAQDKEVRAVLVSGKPFQAFFFGYLLKKEFPHVLWVPDYRDEWNTHEKRIPDNVLERWVFALEKKSEKKWVSNADFFVSVSDACVQAIGAFTHKTGKSVPNGFDPIHNHAAQADTADKPLTVCYLGTLYGFQEMDRFLAACKEVVSIHGKNLRVNFVGINVIPEQKKRVERLSRGYETYFRIVDRVPKETAQRYMMEADVLLLTAYTGIRTWEPVKLFEYYAAQKPMLLFPSDSGVMEQFLQTTGAGYTAHSHEACVNHLLALIRRKEAGESLKTPYDPAIAHGYSRESRTQTLASLLDQSLYPTPI